MRIGVLSDTHGALDRAEKALRRMGEIDMLLHAGDHYRDAGQLARLLAVPVHAVTGNCDYRAGGPEELLLDVGGVTIWLTHGHLYEVHFSGQKLLHRAREQNARVVVYGHTHVPFNRECDGVLLFNPGSIYHPRGGSGPGYGLLDIEAGRVKAELCEL
ncbi:metallophosphoesterase family protein [Desulfotomaculum copahuensis]|uniref:Phosphoesterase n=1 Tax=Desulfotomaculum copahuensis TaxID=1838280 RepID=A0A1B7LF22_9FIRM|nr:metallophosphoesterase [Desulfotomaculum copahuensis]OAT82239.1 hypothetical protein A6M21_08715 [Desulfotomaculum copahuensis]